MPRGRGYGRRRRNTRPRRRQNYKRKFIVPYAKRGYLRTGGFYRRDGYGTHGEVKFYDELNINGNNPAANDGTIWSGSLVNIIEGTSPSERIGRKITVTGVGLKIVLNLPQAATAAAAFDGVRIILYHDKQANGATATAAQLLDSTPSVSIVSYRNLSNINRFRFLYDKKFVITAQNSGGSVYVAGQTQKLINVWANLNVPVEYSGSTGNISEIRSHNFGILVIADNSQATLVINSRVRYTDR